MDTPPPRPCRQRSGFTLIELLLAIAIVLIACTLLLPALSLIRTSSERTLCASNLRQLYFGVRLYAQDNDDYLPALYAGKPWYTLLRTEGYVSTDKAFFCPSSLHEPELKASTISYGYNFHITEKVGNVSTVQLGSLPYPDKFILIADSIDAGKEQYYAMRNKDVIRAGARHNGKIQFVRADGAVDLRQPEDLRYNEYWLPAGQ